MRIFGWTIDFYMDMHEILKLNVNERILLIGKIWDSIDHADIELSLTHEQELDRRLARYERGETEFFSWGDIKAELNAGK